MRSIVTALLIIPVTMIFAIFAALGCLSLTKEVPTWFMHTWGRTLMLIGGIRLEITGLENVDPERPAIYMANHASMIDIPVLISALPVHLRFIFKKSILYIPFLGQAIYLMGMIPIDRGNRLKASASLHKAGDRIRGGYHVLIFPEGTRTKTGELLPFKKGGFHLALSERIDIVPISIENSRDVCGRSSMLARPGILRIKIHERYPTQHLDTTDRNKVVQDIRAIISSGLPKRKASQSA